MTKVVTLCYVCSALPVCCATNDAVVVGRRRRCYQETTDSSHEKPVDILHCCT